MPQQIARGASHAPWATLAACLILLAGLGVVAAGAIERLAPGGGAARGTESVELREGVGAELGFDPVPAAVILLDSEVPAQAQETAATIAALTSQAEALDGVERVVAREPRSFGEMPALSIHLAPDAGPEAGAELVDALAERVDPGTLFEAAIGGPEAVPAALRSEVDRLSPTLLLIALPAIALVLLVGLGLRIGLATLLAVALAVAASMALLSLIDAITTVRAIALLAATATAALLAAEVAASLVYRYRDEAGTMGAGGEALAYATTEVVARGALAGVVGCLLVGIAALLAPVPAVQALGVGVIVAALVAPPLAIAPIAAVLALRGDAEIGDPLPLVADDRDASGASRGFRALLALGRRRRRALIGLLPLAAGAALLLSSLDAEAVGVSAADLPDDDPVREAELGDGLRAIVPGPLLVSSPAPPEAPSVDILRNELLGVEGVAAVGAAEAVGGPGAAPRLRSLGRSGSFFAADLEDLPGSLAAQATVEGVREAETLPAEGAVGGPAAELRDAGELLGGRLPVHGLAAVLAAAVLGMLAFRLPVAPLLALAAALPVIAGVAAVDLIFGEGWLSGALDYEPFGAPHLLTYAAVGAPLLAIGLFRAATLAGAMREERQLGGGAAGSLARSGLLTIKPAALSTLLVVVLCASWLGSGILPAQEIALGLGVGVLFDLLAVRMLLAPALVRAAI